jgi:hypothetical protein
MTTQAKFHITTKNGRQRALWLRLFGSDVLPVTAAAPHEVFTPDGRARQVYDLDVVAIGTNGRRRLAAYVAARRWGITFEQALRDVAFGWTIDATDCELAIQPLSRAGHRTGAEFARRNAQRDFRPNCATKRPYASPAPEIAGTTGVRPVAGQRPHPCYDGLLRSRKLTIRLHCNSERRDLWQRLAMTKA